MEVDLRANARRSGPMTKVPSGAIDYGQGFFIEIVCSVSGNVSFRSCTPGGAICRYSCDLWQADAYLRQMMPLYYSAK